MLQRSEASEGGVDCDDPVITIACLDPELDAYKECPAACRDDASDEKDSDEKVKSGNLAVEADSNNGGVILADGVSDMDTLTFKTSEEVEITKVVLERYGYSKNDDIAGLRLENEDGVIISNEVDSLNSKGQATLTLKKDYRNVDGTLSATLVISTKASAGSGNKTIGFKVIDVDSTAKNLDLDDYKPYTYSVVNYDGADVTITARGSSKTYNWEAGETYEVAKFKLKAPSDSAITVKSFTLKDKLNNAIEYDDYLEDVKVTVAGKDVKSSYSINKDDELVISIKDVELAAKDNAEFVVFIKLSDAFDNMGKAVNFYIEKAGDISATDVKTESRVEVKTSDGKALSSESTLNWPTYTFQGGKIKISSTKLGNIEASEDSTDIVIAEGEITTSQTIKAKNLVVTVTNANNTSGGTNYNVVRAMRLEIAGDEYEGTPVKDTNDIITKFTFPTVDVEKSGKIRILVDTIDKNGVENSYATFKLEGIKDTASASGFYYEDSKTSADVAGSLNISRLTIAASKASLTNTISSDEVEFKAGENSEETTILKGVYTAKKRDTYLNEFAFSGASTAWTAGNPMTVYLYINGEAVADGELKAQADNSWLAKDSFTNVKVKAGETAEIELRAQVEAAENTTFAPSSRLTLYVWGEDENGNPNMGKADRQAAKLAIVVKGTAEIETSKSKSTVLLRGVTDAIAEFIVKPSGSNSFDLESVEFSGTSIACEKLKLEGAANEDFVTSADGTKCVADGFVENIDKSGETLRIVFDEEPDANQNLIEVKIEGLEINGKPISNKFSKAYADAVISFNQTDNKSYTKYTIVDINKYNGSTQVSDLHLYNAAGEEFATSLKDGETLSKDDTFTIDNLSDSEKIQIIEYTVARAGFSQTVRVEYSDYPDYFKTNNDDLRVYANGKDNDTAGKTNKKTSGGSTTPTTTYNNYTVSFDADFKATLTQDELGSGANNGGTGLVAGPYYVASGTAYNNYTVSISADFKATLTQDELGSGANNGGTELFAGPYYVASGATA